MNKIPNEINGDIFIGKTLNSLSFGSNYIIIFFDELLVQFSGPFNLRCKDFEIRIEEVYGLKNDCGLIPIIGQEVTAVHIDQGRITMTLVFGNELELSLISGECFESFEILWNNKRYFI